MADDTIDAKETRGSLIRSTGCWVLLLVVVCVNHPPQYDEGVEIGSASGEWIRRSFFNVCIVEKSDSMEG
jgi:hypothetical protein